MVEALAGARLLTLDGDTVEIAHEALLTAWPRLRGWIEEDCERLRVHRNLTEAAHAWQELGREEGALYRGSRLAAAQEHFGGAPREDLTDLERAYLDAGRDHEQKGRRRSRLVLTAVTAALCVALVAGGLAVGQWRSAVTAQHLAQSRQLAAQSGALLDSVPDLAALLAVHAYRTSPTREATAALYAAAALPLRKRLVGGAQPVDSLALSPDGHTVAANSRDGKVRIWSLPGGRLRHTFTGYDSGEVAAFSPDGGTLAVAFTRGADGVIALLDPVTGRKLGTITVPDGSVRGIAFSPDGRTVAAASVTTVRVWDVATGRTRTVGGGRIDGRAVAFSPDGRTYAVVRAGGSVQLREVATGIVRHTLKDVPVGMNELAFAPDGRTIAVPSPGDTVRLWDTASGAARATMTAGHHGRGTMKVALGADGRTQVTSNNGDPDVRVHRLPADLPQTTLPGSADTSIDDMVFSLGRVPPPARQVERGCAGAVRPPPAGTGSSGPWRPASWTRRTGSAPYCPARTPSLRTRGSVSATPS
ncbi:UNVERIFIED_CONTAM: sugar lactone lactonase YvrE [Streptomyces canus]